MDWYWSFCRGTVEVFSESLGEICDDPVVCQKDIVTVTQSLSGLEALVFRFELLYIDYTSDSFGEVGRESGMTK